MKCFFICFFIFQIGLNQVMHIPSDSFCHANTLYADKKKILLSLLDSCRCSHLLSTPQYMRSGDRRVDRQTCTAVTWLYYQCAGAGKAIKNIKRKGFILRLLTGNMYGEMAFFGGNHTCSPIPTPGLELYSWSQTPSHNCYSSLASHVSLTVVLSYGKCTCLVAGKLK